LVGVQLLQFHTGGKYVRVGIELLEILNGDFGVKNEGIREAQHVAPWNQM
jgi:hypothetical protein